MEKSPTIAELAKALSAFQNEVKPIIFDAKNPFFKNDYASHKALVNATKDLLFKNGLAVSQLTEDEGAVTTILLHSSGEYIASKLTLKPVKDDPQGRGSCITYARRYSYAAILGLISDHDDDGNAASQSNGNGKVEYIAEKDVHNLRDQLIDLGKEEGKFLSYMGIESLEKLPRAQLQKAQNLLDSARQKAVKK